MSIPDHGKRRLVTTLAAGAAALACPSFLVVASGRAAAQGTFPSRPIRIVVPFTPGGGTDLVARTVAEGMARELGQSVIIDNKPGAGTVIGSDMVAKAPADGYTLLVTTSAHAINSSLVKSLPYSTEKSFADVSLIARGPNMLVTSPGRPYRTVQDVIDAARANPGKLNYGSSGNGTAVHLAGELFKLMAKVDITHVPYRGAGPAYTDLMGGQIDLVFATAGRRRQARRERQDARAGRDLASPVAFVAAGADDGRIGRAGLRSRCLVRGIRQRRHAARRRRAPQRRRAPGHRVTALPRTRGQRGPDRGALLARGTHALRARRGVALAQGGGRRQGDDRLNAARILRQQGPT